MRYAKRMLSLLIFAPVLYGCPSLPVCPEPAKLPPAPANVMQPQQGHFLDRFLKLLQPSTPKPTL